MRNTAADPDCPAVMLVDIADDWTTEVSGHVWVVMLAMARQYGWRPTGTVRQSARGLPWDGAYYPPESQTMTGKDVEALRAALKSALEDIPHHDARGNLDALLKSPAAVVALSGVNRKTVLDVANFLFDGDVEIHPVEEDVDVSRLPRLVLHHRYEAESSS